MQAQHERNKRAAGSRTASDGATLLRPSGGVVRYQRRSVVPHDLPWRRVVSYKVGRSRTTTTTTANTPKQHTTKKNIDDHRTDTLRVADTNRRISI